MNDPNYIQSESEIANEKDKSDNEDLVFDQNLQQLYTERDLYRIDTERDLREDEKEDNFGTSKGVFSNDKLTKSTKMSSAGKSTRKENETSFRFMNENHSLISGSTVKRGGTFNFDEELRRLQTIDKIGKKLKRSGTNPESLLVP